MARMAGIAGKVEALLRTAVVATTPVAGGDVCSATRVRLSDGRNAFVKTRSQVPDDFFAVEAAGLRWLGEAAGGAAVPEVLACSTDCLVLSWVEAGRPTPEVVESFARRLAATHAAGADAFGAQRPGYIGAAALPNTPSDAWPHFWVMHRLLPYLRAARDRRAISPGDAAAVDAVIDNIDALAGPQEPPSRIHGDLWSGNVVWSATGEGVLVDPAAHGGSRETDLAMLMLFGAAHLSRLLEAYQEVHPLADGWLERVPLHQLHPLLVHAATFGGSYGARAGDAARTVLAAHQVVT
ncbi:MAG: fructosamine kinase family protein [Nocardioidaceae bacterium]